MIYHSKANCWNCFIVCRFLLSVWITTMASANISCPKQLREKFKSFDASWIRTEEEKVQWWHSWCDRHPFPILVNFPENIISNSPLSWAIRQSYKQVQSTGSVKRQKESERKGISDHIQLLFNNFGRQIHYPGPLLTLNLLLNNLLLNCWIPVRSDLPFGFLLPVDRACPPNLFVPLSYGPDDAGFWCNVFWKVYKNGWAQNDLSCRRALKPQ